MKRYVVMKELICDLAVQCSCSVNDFLTGASSLTITTSTTPSFISEHSAHFNSGLLPANQRHNVRWNLVGEPQPSLEFRSSRLAKQANRIQFILLFFSNHDSNRYNVEVTRASRLYRAVYC